MAVLYHTPNLDPPHRAFALLEHLRQKPETGHRIKCIVAAANPLLSRTTPGLGVFPLEKLLELCLGLREIWITDRGEEAPFRNVEGEAGFKWTHDTISSLEGRRIKAWSWNLSHIWPGGNFREVHSSAAFASLRRLRIVGHIPGDALEGLKELRELEIVKCDKDPNLTFTPALLLDSGIRLRKLVFKAVTASGLTSEFLTEVLTSPLCSELEEHVILHCRAANLAFLHALPGTVRDVEFDGLLYSSSSITAVDTTPLYSELYPLNPTSDGAIDLTTTTPRLVWPKGLHNLVLLNLRKWNQDAAEALLSSLVEEENGGLRVNKLELHVILEESSWRERAAFRDIWEERLVGRFGAAGKVVIKVDAQRPGEVRFTEESFAEGGRVLGGVRKRVRNAIVGGGKATRGRGKGVVRGRGSGGGRGKGRKRVRDSDDDDEEDEDYEDDG